MFYFFNKKIILTASLVLFVVNIFILLEAKATTQARIDLPKTLEASQVVVYGKLSLNSNIGKNRRSDDLDVVDFFIEQVFRGDEKDTILTLCNFPRKGYLEGSFKRKKEGYYILFLIKSRSDECYDAFDIVNITNNRKVANTSEILDEPASQPIQEFIKKIKIGVKKQEKLWGKIRNEMRMQREEEKKQREKISKKDEFTFISETITIEPDLDLSKLIRYSSFIAYGRLSLDSNIEWEKRLDTQDVVDFFIEDVFKGEEKNILIPICDFVGIKGSLNRIFRKGKNGKHILFLMGSPYGMCYFAFDLGSKVGVMDDEKNVDTRFIKDEPARQSLQEFLEKIKMEVRRQKDEMDKIDK